MPRKTPKKYPALIIRPYFSGNQWVFIVPKNKAGYLLGGGGIGGAPLDSHDGKIIALEFLFSMFTVTTG